MKRPVTCLAVLGLTLAGCSGPGGVVHSFKDGDVTTTRHVAFFAQASAGGVFATAFSPAYGFAHGPVTESCPKVTDDGRTLTVKGDGCKTQDDLPVFGTMTFVRSGGSLLVAKASTGGTPLEIPFGTLSFDGFGQTTDGPCPNASWVTGTFAPKTTGTASISADGATGARFTVDLRTDAPEKTPTSCPPAPLTTAAEYQGSIAAAGNGQVTLAGSGTFGTSLDGKVSASTMGESFGVDGAHPVLWRGTTTLRAGGHVSVLQYGHGVDRPMPTDWTLDGKDQGGLWSVTCATMPGRGGMPGLLSVLTVLGLVALRRRRAPGRG